MVKLNEYSKQYRRLLLVIIFFALANVSHFGIYGLGGLVPQPGYICWKTGPTTIDNWKDKAPAGIVSSGYCFAFYSYRPVDEEGNNTCAAPPDHPACGTTEPDPPVEPPDPPVEPPDPEVTDGVDPWFSTSGSNIYVQNVINNPGAPESGYFATNANKSYMAEYTFASSLQTYDTDRKSYEDLTLLDYRGRNLVPPALSGYQNWYGYLKRLVQLNTGINNPQSITTLSGNLNNRFPSSSAKKAYVLSGDVTVNMGTVCNTKALIFVEGNLTIEPSFTIADKAINYTGGRAEGQACMFVVQGYTVVKPGASAVSTGDSGLSINFDLLEMAVVNGSGMVVEYEAEPLKIYGFSVGDLADVQRNTKNADLPSFWVEYDPRYGQIFKDELKLSRFSTREKGYTVSFK